MKYKIYDEEANPDELEEVYLRLVKCGDSIYLIAADKAGDKLYLGNLLAFTSGEIHACPNVNERFGFNLDSEGYLIIDKTDERYKY